MKPTVMVTGSSGWLGSEVCFHALEAGYRVVATARRLSSDFRKEMDASTMLWDVLNPSPSKPLPRSIEALIHCATPNDIISKNFHAGMRLAVEGTKNILDFALLHHIKKVIFFSTTQVYGSEPIGMVNERRPVQCDSAYALNHFFGEELCRMYSRKHALDIILIRPSNVFGVPRASTVQRESLVPTCFIKELVKSGKITLRTSGYQRRNFVPSTEVARFCISLLKSFPRGCSIRNVVSLWSPRIREIAVMTMNIYRKRQGVQPKLKILSSLPRPKRSLSLHSLWGPVPLTRKQCRCAMEQTIQSWFEKIESGRKRAYG